MGSGAEFHDSGRVGDVDSFRVKLMGESESVYIIESKSTPKVD